MSQLTFSLEAPPASRSPSQGSEPDWLTPAATSCSPILPLLQNVAPSGWSGRMSPEFCRQTEDGTLEPSSGAWANSGMGSPTECLTLNSVEHMAMIELSHNVGAVCSLSDILETGDVPQRYYLTARACAGILRRADKRGKVLPPQLAAALQAVAGSEPTLTSMAA